jgi:hypothetical protein
VTAVVGDPDAATVSLQFQGVSPLYQNFFSQEKMVGPFATALGACVHGAVDVIIRYDSEQRIGYILARPDARAFGCTPTPLDSGGYDLTPMGPASVALAGYRDAVAASYDLRISSFRTGVEFLRGTKMCTLELAGQYPPDGSSWSACPKFAGNERCVRSGLTRLDGVTELAYAQREHAAYLSACFGG